MKICFPAETLQGLDSTVYEHFGSAPGFVVVDTESMSVSEISNDDRHHPPGGCQPIRALGGHKVDAVAVGGIGMGALMKLQAQGVKVYRAAQGTVAQNIVLILSHALPEFETRFTCGGHNGGECAH